MTDEEKKEQTAEQQAEQVEETAEQQAADTAAESQAEKMPDEEKQETAENETAEAKAEEAKAAEPTVEDLKKKIAELEDKFLRSRAEFDNYRKRMAREFTENRDQTRRNTVTDFLTVYDYFKMGMDAITQAPSIEILKQGMEMIWAEFQKVLDGMGVKALDAVGKPFDAKFHEAVSQEASDTVPEGTVLRQWKAAFTMGDKLLRPAVVVVSSGPAKPVEVKAEEPAEDKPETEEKEQA